MIHKLLRLNNVGLLHGSTGPNGFVEFSKATAVYAENGRGKSTLASVFRACQLGDGKRLHARTTIDLVGDPEVKLRLASGGANVEFTNGSWTRSLPNIAVFDSEFVEENVYSGFEVRADQRQSLLEFALGDDTVHLQREIERITAAISEQSAIRRRAEQLLNSHAAPMALAQFIALQPVHDLDSQIEQLRTRLEASKISDRLTARAGPTELTSLEFDPEPVFSVLAATVEAVADDAEATVKAHIGKRSESVGLEDWLSRGQTYLVGEDCPFCGQSLDHVGLISAYRAHFNKAYAAHKQRVTALVSTVTRDLGDSLVAALERLVETNSARIGAWKDHLDLTLRPFPGVEARTALERARQKLSSLIEAKQLAPLEAVGAEADADVIHSVFSEINRAIAEYNESVRAAAAAIAQFKQGLASERSADLSEKIRQLESIRERFRPAVVDAVSDYKAADTERKRLDGEKDSTRGQLDALMKTTLTLYQDEVNRLLSKFGASFTIEKLQPTYIGGGTPRSEFGIKLRNKSVKLGTRADLTAGHGFASTLSEADKRTLAFAFFVARLQADPNLADRIVVMDDPVSSLDRNRRHETVKCIVELVDKCSQLIVLSHDAYFVRDLRDTLGGKRNGCTDLSTLSLRRAAHGYSAFDNCNIDGVCASAYIAHYNDVSLYVAGEFRSDIRAIAKSIRPLLEGYYHRRFPNRISRRLMFGQVIAEAAQAAQPDPLSELKPILAEMSAVNDYAGRFHHDTNPDPDSVAVVDTELLQFAERALNLIHRNG